MRTAVLLSVVAVLFVTAGCGGSGGPDADEGKTPDQIKTQAAEMDKATLEKTIEAYKAKIEKLAEEAKGDLTKMAEGMGEKLAKLNENLKIYMDELAKKN